MALALPRRSTRAASDRVDKRELILKAAVRTFADRGFFGAQVADVARAAGVAAGTVYLYFRGKDDLLVSIFERTMREAITEGKAALAEASSPLDRLRRSPTPIAPPTQPARELRPRAAGRLRALRPGPAGSEGFPSKGL